MFLLFGFFLLSIGFSFLCSILEAVLLSITPAFTQQKLAEGGPIGKSLEKYKAEIDRPLSAILSLNTIAHTVGAIGVGAMAGEVFGKNYLNLGTLPVIGELSISYESIIAVVMTLAILILSEIIPKTLGANNWKSLTPFTIRTLNILMWILSPFVWISQLITKSMKKNKGESVLSRADFAAMTQVGSESGALDKNESKIIKNLLRFQTIKTKDIMTPRTLMKAAKEEQTIGEFFVENKQLQFSRIPVYENKLDDITGFVLKDDIYKLMAEDKPNIKLKEIKHEVMAVNNEQPLPELLDSLSHRRKHLAVVVDEFGSVLGVITLEDVLETLLGLEIMDESDAAPDLQALARQKWEERAKSLGMID